MPIENEKKYIMNFHCESIVSNNSTKKTNIEQGYLVRKDGLTVRIRKSTDKYDTHYCFTLKQRVDNKIVEIENEISKKDFNLLATKASAWVQKDRYYLDGNWVVDFFRNKELYFVMAEIEMPEDVEEPDFIHPIVAQNLIYAVKKEDSRFSSKKLSDMEYAKKLLKEVVGYVFS